MTETAPKTHVYFNQSALILKINSAIFLIGMATNFVLSPLAASNAALLGIFEFVMGGAFLALLVLAPIGLVQAIKSNRRKEGTAQQRFMHNLGHGFFCLLDVFFIAVFVSDIVKLFTM